MDYKEKNIPNINNEESIPLFILGLGCLAILLGFISPVFALVPYVCATYQAFGSKNKFAIAFVVCIGIFLAALLLVLFNQTGQNIEQ